MNSCLYDCNVMHCRVSPRRYQFNHRIFMFYLDLDEIDDLAKNIFLLSRNRSNVFNFRDDEHFELDRRSAKDKVLAYVNTQDSSLSIKRIMLLTNLRTMGYSFNPVSFFYCFDENDRPVCVVPEIGNTYREIKPFYLGPRSWRDEKFVSQQIKYYYISPFVDLNVPLDFQLKIPGERLDVHIDDVGPKGKSLYASLSGRRKALNNRSLFWYGLRFPFITLKVIILIHWHAAILHFVKNIPHHAKESNPQYQKEVYRVWSKN